MKYKNIKSVAHNLGHSFMSDVNAVTGGGAGYHIVPAELFARAAEARVAGVVVDFMGGSVEPPELATPTVVQSVVNYARELLWLCQAQNVDVNSVRSAKLMIEFDYTRRRTRRYHPHEFVQEFACRVEIVDDRGITHVGRPSNSWFE